MARSDANDFSRRERQVMDVLYRLRDASVAEVLDHMPEPTTYDAVRLTLVSLAEKGHITHRRDGRKYIYTPSVPHRAASRSAVKRLLRTYFDESPSKAILALLDVSSGGLDDEELEEIERLVREAKESAG